MNRKAKNIMAKNGKHAPEKKKTQGDTWVDWVTSNSVMIQLVLWGLLGIGFVWALVQNLIV